MNVPKVILELEGFKQQYLEAVNSSRQSAEQVQKLEKIQKSLKQFDVKDHVSIAKRVFAAFQWVHENLGYDKFREMAIRMKRMPSLDQEQYSEAKGELAEVFLYRTILQWIEKRGLGYKWKVYHHLMIPFMSGKGYTEIDVLLAGKNMMVVFECKSFNGKKIINKECYVKTSSGRGHDIYKQNGMHCKALWEHISPLSLGDVGLMKSVMFSFAVGMIEDKRTPDYKRLIPVLDEDSLVIFLDSLNTQAIATRWKPMVLTILDGFAEREYDQAEHACQIKERRGEI